MVTKDRKTKNTPGEMVYWWRLLNTQVIFQMVGIIEWNIIIVIYLDMTYWPAEQTHTRLVVYFNVERTITIITEMSNLDTWCNLTISQTNPYSVLLQLLVN